jgi:hypothetical protein
VKGFFEMFLQVLLGSFALDKKVKNDLQILVAAPGPFKGIGPDFLVADQSQCLFGRLRVIPEFG